MLAQKFWASCHVLAESILWYQWFWYSKIDESANANPLNHPAITTVRITIEDVRIVLLHSHAENNVTGLQKLKKTPKGRKRSLEVYAETVLLEFFICFPLQENPGIP